MLSSDLKTMLPSSRQFLMAVNKKLKSDVVVDVDCVMFLTPLPPPLGTKALLDEPMHVRGASIRPRFRSALCLMHLGTLCIANP